jgi:hypothetical protein
MNPRVKSACALILAYLILLLAVSGCASSPPPEQERFSSPDAAAASFVNALRGHDEARLKKILGPQGAAILSSGDPVSDRADAAGFLSLYEENHWVQPEPDGTTTLVVGQAAWPFPVPIVKAGDAYAFDSETGKEEVLNRRIGRNELSAQQVCLAIADAQRDYVALQRNGSDLPEYAWKLVSDPGKKNGLYWPTAEGEPPSPLGPLAASATAEGYGPSTGASNGTSNGALNGASGASRPRPYHGYHYRLLTAQGPHANGGALDYLVNGKLIGGFAVVAYPAQYGNSGIVTFITNHDGIVYQRDLGPDTPRIAQRLTQFDPGPGWTKAADAAKADYN